MNQNLSYGKGGARSRAGAILSSGPKCPVALCWPLLCCSLSLLRNSVYRGNTWKKTAEGKALLIETMQSPHWKTLKRHREAFKVGTWPAAWPHPPSAGWASSDISKSLLCFSSGLSLPLPRDSKAYSSDLHGCPIPPATRERNLYL